MDYRNAVVTGASSGLGAGITRRLAARGVRVFALARRGELLEQLAAEAGPGTVVPIPMDVTDTTALVELLRRLDRENDGLDLVVANAGIGGNKRATRLNWEDWVEPTLRVNVLGAFATLTAVLPAMVERNRGHLVGISSQAAVRGLPGAAAYSASKAALSTYLETLRVDLRHTGLQVTTIHPGFVRTPLNENLGQMPFVMTLEPALDRIMKAIDAGSGAYAFPFPITAATRLARLLPDAVWDRVAGRRGKRGR